MNELDQSLGALLEAGDRGEQLGAHIGVEAPEDLGSVGDIGQNVLQPLRAALTGKTVSPPVFDVMAVLGRSEAVARIRDQAASLDEVP